jgi:hypothetical protein
MDACGPNFVIPRSDLWPDPSRSSCMAAFNHSDKLPSFVSRDGAWHHLAVTWDGAKDGLTQVWGAGANLQEKKDSLSLDTCRGATRAALRRWCAAAL